MSKNSAVPSHTLMNFTQLRAQQIFDDSTIPQLRRHMQQQVKNYKLFVLLFVFFASTFCLFRVLRQLHCIEQNPDKRLVRILCSYTQKVLRRISPHICKSYIYYNYQHTVPSAFEVVCTLKCFCVWPQFCRFE